MSNDHERDPRPAPDPEAELLRLIAAVPVEAPSAEAREAARVAFVEGRRMPRSRAPSGAGPRPIALPRVLVGLAAAAAVAGLIWVGGQPTDSWRVVATGDGPPTVDARSAPVGTEFRSGRIVAGPGGDLHVQLGERIRLCLPPGSVADLPAGPGRWRGRERTLRVTEGSLFASSGDRRLGFDLLVATEEARVHVAGTTFAVECTELGTCVCLYDGEVLVETAGGAAPVPVPAGRRLQCHRDNRPPTVELLSSAQVGMLKSLYETVASASGGI